MSPMAYETDRAKRRPPPPPPPRTAEEDAARTKRQALVIAVGSVLAGLLILLLVLLLLRDSAERKGGGHGTERGDGAGHADGKGTGDGAAVGVGRGESSGEKGGATGSGAGGQAEKPTAQPHPATPPPQESKPESRPKPTRSEEPPMLILHDKKVPDGGAGRVQRVPGDEGGGGTGGEGRGRGDGRGGRPLGTGDVSFRLYWNPPLNDLDLHVIDPNGHHLWFEAMSCRCGGLLDRDDKSGGGPENIFWPIGKGPHGRYTFYAHYYDGARSKTITIEVRKEGNVIKRQTAVLNAVNDESPRFTYDHPGPESPRP